MKKNKNTKALLFEMIGKLEPEFNSKETLNEIGNFHDSFIQRTGQSFRDDNDKWNNGAFHIRYRMLLNLGVDEVLAEKYADELENKTWDEVKAIVGQSNVSEALGEVNVRDYNIKVERLKALMDDLLEKQEYEVLDTLYRLMIDRKKQVTPTPMAEAMGGINPYFKEDIDAYNKKVQSIKAKLDFLMNNMHFEYIDKIDTIMQKIPNKTTEVSEIAKPQQNDTYFDTLSAALDAVRTKVEERGFTVDEDVMFTQFGTGGIGYGETKRANIPLLRNGIPDKRRTVTIAIYRMDSGKYELTAYLN